MLASCAYLLGTTAFLWPMPSLIHTAIWGDRFDAWTTLWLIDHLGERIADGNWSTVTTEILHPLGYNLWSFGHMGLQLIGGALVALGVPLVLSYNLLLMAGIWTSALCPAAVRGGDGGTVRARVAGWMCGRPRAGGGVRHVRWRDCRAGRIRRENV